VLLEAVSRVYFPSLAVDEFINCIEHVLHVPVSQLTDEELRHFTGFYRLPSNCLQTRKVITFEDFERFFPQIEYSFRSQCGGDTAAVSSWPGAIVPGAAANAPTVVSVLQKANTVKADTPQTETTTTTQRPRKRVSSDVIVIDD